MGLAFHLIIPAESPFPFSTMTKTDWAVVGLNALTLIVAVVGLLDPRGGSYDGPNIALLLSIVVLMVNGGWIIRRGSREPTQKAPSASDSSDVTLDAHRLLEIDERLELLERRDTLLIRELMARGEMRGPAAPLTESVGATEGARQRT